MLLFTAFPDVRFDVEDPVGEGDRVAARVKLRGTHQDEFKGVPATGTQVAAAGIGICRVVDNAIAEIWFVGDDLAILQQIGAVPDD